METLFRGRILLIKDRGRYYFRVSTINNDKGLSVDMFSAEEMMEVLVELSKGMENSVEVIEQNVVDGVLSRGYDLDKVMNESHMVLDSIIEEIIGRCD